ncbi:hypothetical protein DYB30_007153 [Aphanomyces astaci]|uniref:Protein kinase domain-containing protein n=1 Tax=Aphanomyces astaci TaxID=112090 RepID=A0A397E9P3_APHAT|nr:hypothetical protein DYB30_007153 [Aphanomyces astaci]
MLISSSRVDVKDDVMSTASYSSAASYASSELSVDDAVNVVSLPSSFDHLVAASSVELPRKQGVLQVPKASRWTMTPWRKPVATLVDCWVTFNGRDLSWFKSSGHGVYKPTPVCTLDLSSSMYIQFQDLAADTFAIVESIPTDTLHNQPSSSMSRNRSSSTSSRLATKTRHVFTARDVADKLAWLQVLVDALHIQDWYSGFRIGRLLGQGGSSSVHLLTDVSTGSTFALKSIDTNGQPGHAELATNEVTILQHVAACAGTSPYLKSHVTKLVKVVGDHKGRVGLVMPFHRGGTLADRIGGLLSRPHCIRREAQSKQLARTLLSTLLALHTNAGVLHLDIKPSNILFRDMANNDDDVATMVLADFGFAHQLVDVVNYSPDATAATTTTTITSTTPTRGTIGYMAPELVEFQFGHGRATTDDHDDHRPPPLPPAADVFSAGVVLFQYLIGCMPFPGSHPDKVVERMLRGHMVRPQAQWELVSPEGQLFVLSMLERTPSQRPTVADLLALPWLETSYV